MADIVVANAKKVNLLDKIIQSVVITVNLSKMNRAIEEHIDKFREVLETEKEDNLEKVLREIVYLKYQYEIIQRNMYELKITYTDELLEKINTSEKMERLKVQKTLFEMEYDRLSKSKFQSKESIKYRLLTVSSVLDKIKQEIKDEGKLERYDLIIKTGEAMDENINSNSFTDEMYTELITHVNNYTNYINENYDIAKLPVDERELIELIFEATLGDKLTSDIDRLNHEFELLVNICKNAYVYFKAIDKVFEKILAIYDDMYATKVIDEKDYFEYFKDLFDVVIKTKVNDVKRTLEIEDEYMEYCKILIEPEKLEDYLIKEAFKITKNETVKNLLQEKLDKKELEEETKKLEEKEEMQEKEEIQDTVEDVSKKDQEEKIEEVKPIKVRRRGGATVENETKEKSLEIKKEEKQSIGARKGLGAFGRRKVESV